ncbi:hypothetical protein GCM10007890_36940 [Methylobacterium tardum]|uniref:Uncharacterized protein n=1 Tax=Methylobacterium tardum TaxID=374432 RepID=A0AA37WT15_9HYPH|nr:hypothetical protein GCM10007890_36940 [Methylobacterium tardum]
MERLKELPVLPVPAVSAEERPASKGNGRRILPGVLPTLAPSNVAKPHSPTAHVDAVNPSVAETSVGQSRDEQGVQRAPVVTEARRGDTTIKACAEPVLEVLDPAPSADATRSKRKTNPNFRAGERWKRRLPRAGWSSRRSVRAD